MYNRNVSEKVRATSEKLAEAEDAEAFFFFHVTGFYRDYGVGMFGLNKAFRIAGNEDGPSALPSHQQYGCSDAGRSHWL